MSKLKTLKEKRASVYTQIDELRKATDGKEMSSEEQKRWDNLLLDFEKADKAVEQEERFQDVQRKQMEQRTETHQAESTDEEYRSAFTEYLLRGNNGLSPEQTAIFEKRAGLSGLNGGVIIPKSMASAIEVALKNYGGMFEAGQIITTATGGDLIMPTINDTASKATVVTEYNQGTKKAPSFGSEVLKAYTYRTPIVPVSQELLQDSSFDLDALLSGLLADSFGRGVNEDLTIGSGEGKPKGIITSATDSGIKATATGITLDNVIDLIKSVDSAYARNGKFMFNRNTLYSLIKIKDSTGNFIWQSGAKDGLPPTLFGKAYILNDDIPDIAAGKASMLFGDFSKYKIRMVKNFRIIRLNEVLAEYLSIGLFGFARVDGVLLDAGTHPIKKLIHANA